MISLSAVIAIMASILAARKLAQFDSSGRVPATINAIADAVRWAERIMEAAVATDSSPWSRIWSPLKTGSAVLTWASSSAPLGTHGWPFSWASNFSNTTDGQLSGLVRCGIVGMHLSTLPKRQPLYRFLENGAAAFLSIVKEIF